MKQFESYCIVTNALYPNGGGESFMRDTLSVVSPVFKNLYWIYFDSKTPDDVVFRSVEMLPGIRVTTINMHGYDCWRLSVCLRFLRPSLVHHQGLRRLEVARICHQLRIPFMSGFHFWNDLIELDKRLQNNQILGNIALNKLHKNFTEIESKATRLYLVSPFMKEVVDAVGGAREMSVHPPIYERFCFGCEVPIRDRKYIGQLNVHPQKGGEIVLALLKDGEFFPPVYLCVTESPNDNWYVGFNAAFENYKNKNKKCISWTKDPLGDIYSKSRILLVPSVVDETFCRVAWEAMAAGCVVISSNMGNLPNIVRHDIDGLVLPFGDTNRWLSEIKRVYNDVSLCATMSNNAVARARELVKGQESALLEMITSCIQPRVGIFTVWADQGLGVQSRVYVDALEKVGIKTCIFSFMPYNIINFKPASAEWDYPDVYQSANNRERVSKTEVQSWVHKNNLTVVIIPEICFSHIFAVTKWIQDAHARVVAVPNIEISRSSEMNMYGMFDRIWANNHFTQNILKNEYGLSSHYVGFELIKKTFTKEVFLEKKYVPPESVVSFLLIGGNNPFYRKNAHKVLECFVKLPPSLNFRLTVTLHVKDSSCLHPSWLSHPNIVIINTHLSYSCITALYKTHRIYLQLSTNEGLGINMFEALENGMALVTFDYPPYNEVVPKTPYNKHIPAQQITMLDNKEAIIKACDFKASDLDAIVVEMIQQGANRPPQNKETKKTGESFFEKSLAIGVTF